MVPTSLAQFAEDKIALIIESETGQDLNTLLGDKPFTAIFSVPAVGLFDLQAHRTVFWSHPLVGKRAQQEQELTYCVREEAGHNESNRMWATVITNQSCKYTFEPQTNATKYTKANQSPPHLVHRNKEPGKESAVSSPEAINTVTAYLKNPVQRDRENT